MFVSLVTIIIITYNKFRSENLLRHSLIVIKTINNVFIGSLITNHINVHRERTDDYKQIVKYSINLLQNTFMNEVIHYLLYSSKLRSRKRLPAVTYKLLPESCVILKCLAITLR